MRRPRKASLHADYDLVVGADEVRSAVRQAFFMVTASRWMTRLAGAGRLARPRDTLMRLLPL
ncbi:hypothetical protein [Nonomuraea dietziae]|uniref:hypothetical protein n=1 Tax=Nonomuraea dietziae TaxID=65515 RepID=UPI0033C40BC7